MKMFEFILPGFDGSTDATDDHIIWVRAPHLETVRSYVLDRAKLKPEKGPYEIDGRFHEGDCDYELPRDGAAFLKRFKKETV